MSQTDKILAFIENYNGLLDEKGIPPNGDDFNALCDGIKRIAAGLEARVIDVKWDGR